MRPQIAAVVLFASLFGLAAVTAAQDAARSITAERFIDTENGLSLEDALRQAVDREPGLRSARTDVDAAQGRRLQATLRPNPSVSVETRQEPTGTDNQTMAQVQWPLDLFRRSARVAVADRAVEVSERAIDDRIRLLTADVRRRYGDAAGAVLALELADQAVDLMSREFELIRQRASEGAVPPLERDQLEVELRRYEADRLLALGRTEALMIELKKAMGIAISTPVRLRDSLEALAPAPLSDTTPSSSRDAAGDASGAGADVQMADAEARLAEARVGTALAQGRFDMSLFGGYMRMNNRFPQFGFNDVGQLEPIHGVFHFMSAGAMVTLPLRNRNQGEVAAARAEQAGAQARLEATQRAARADIAAAEARDTAGRRALAVTESIVGLATKNLDVIRQAYELGRTTATDVLAEQRRYVDVQRANTETMKAAYDAHVALMVARGEH